MTEEDIVALTRGFAPVIVDMLKASETALRADMAVLQARIDAIDRDANAQKAWIERFKKTVDARVRD
jgi:hypothetical protein